MEIFKLDNNDDDLNKQRWLNFGLSLAVGTLFTLIMGLIIFKFTKVKVSEEKRETLFTGYRKQTVNKS